MNGYDGSNPLDDEAPEDGHKKQTQKKQNQWLELGNIKRSSEKSVQSTDIGSMRDLANRAARSAISEHGSRQSRINVIIKTIASIVSVIVAIFLLIWSEHTFDGPFIGGCIAITAGIIWSLQLLYIFRSGAWKLDRD